MLLRVFAPAVVFCVIAGPSGAQQAVKLQFTAGQVTLSAQNTPVRTILAEWARLGGATIVNAERVVGPPVTLELSGISERQALDIILRNVAGYIAAPRPAGSQGASAFNRIMILPTSVAPRPAPAPAAAAGPRPPVARPAFLPRPPDPPEQSEIEDPDPQEDPAALNPASEQRIIRPSVVMRSPTDTDTDPNQAADNGQDNDGTQSGVAPTPANPFGVPLGSSATPGVISPVPPSQQRPRVPANRVQ
jgi:hypothetical protein